MDLTVSGDKSFGNRTNTSSSQNWTVQKNWLQGIDVGRLAGLFEESNKKSVYKLVLKNEWTSEGKVDFERGVKGALGLVKATWKGKSGGENGWKVENIEVNENQKVWLIMAQGDKAIYLMPVVRVAGWWGGNGECTSVTKLKEAQKQINGSGVTDIKSWNFDTSDKWNNSQSEKIKKKVESGFSITRKIETVIFGRMKFGRDEMGASYEKYLKEYERVIGKNQFTWAKRMEHLYKNAGELTVKDGWGDESHYCWRRERYFPLDLVVLNNSPEKVQPKVTNNGKEQTITITDNISKVIGVIR